MSWLPASWPKRISLLLLAVFFVFAGVSHFTREEFFVKIVPPYLPAARFLVQASGVAEIALGLAVLVPQWRALAGWGLLALLVAVYPANIHMALHPEQFPDTSSTFLYARLPFQFLFAAWAWWATRP